MLNKITILFLLLLPAALAFGQVLDCSKLKEGSYRIDDPNAGGTTMIERSARYQVESNENTKVTVRLTVTWLDDCTYQLKFDKLLRNDNNEDMPRITMVVKILEIGKDSYIQETTSDAFKGAYRSKVTKIR